MIRGLFGSSARQAVPFVEPERLENAASLLPAASAPQATSEPETRSYLGGLIKYQRPEAGTGPNALTTIGATLQDVAANLRGDRGGNLEAVQEQFRQRQARAEKESLRKRLEGMIDAQYGDDPEAQALFRADPSAFVEAQLKARQPSVSVERGEDGLYLVDARAGTSKKIQDWQRKAPLGWEWDESGERLRPVENGPYDLDYISNVAGVRREAVVERPMPSRARGGGGGGGRGGGGGSSGLPAGFVLD